MAKTFTYTGGNETITNYNGGDRIYIASGAVDTYSFNDNDLIFKIGDGTLTLKDMKGRAITFKNSLGKTTTKVYGTGYSGQAVIKNLVKAWNTTQLTDLAKLNESIKLCSHFKGIQDVINHMVADCQKAGEADTFLKKYCGIILGNKDTGAITGWDAGGLKVKTAKNIIPEKTPLKVLDDYTQASFVRNNVTINVSSNDDSLTDKGKKVFDGLYSWWAEGALNLIKKSYGVEFDAGKEINIALTSGASYWGQSIGDSVKINLDKTRFKGDDDYHGNGIGRTIAHEFTHVAQNFLMGRTFPRFLKEGLADLTCGIDDRKTSVIKKLASNANLLKKYLNLDNMGDRGNANYYAAGYIFYRYLAKQAADAYDSSTSYAWTNAAIISGTDKANFLTGSGNNSTIIAGVGNDTITAYGDNMNILSKGGNDFILTNGNGITVSGGAGNNTIKNRGDNSSLTSGEGDDLIINGGYWASEHGGSFVTISTGKGNDTLINNGSHSLIDAGRGNDLIYNGYRYYEPTSYFYNANDDNFKGNGSTIIGGRGHNTINNLGDNVLIDAGFGNDIISNGSEYCVGGSFVSIKGGRGNDTITNYGGSFVTIRAGTDDNLIVNVYAADHRDYSQETKQYETIETIFPEHVTFQYRGGNHTIQGFDETSTLQIGNGSATYSKENVGSSVIVTTGKGKITLDGAASLSAVNIKGKEVNVCQFVFSIEKEIDVEEELAQLQRQDLITCQYRT